MNVQELQSALKRLEKIYSGGGAVKQADSLASLIESLEGHLDCSVDDFVERVSAEFAGKKPVDAPKTVAANDGVVRQHVEALFASGTNRELFDQAFNALKASATAKAAECFEIANVYKNRPTGGTYRYKFTSKNKALEFIFETYITRAQEESKAGIIARITKWAS